MAAGAQVVAGRVAVAKHRMASWVVVAAATAVALAGIAIPIFAVERLPLHDYPNHLARMHLITRWADFPALHRFYDPAGFVVPNIAMDVIVVALAHVVPVDVATRLFTFGTLALCFTGTVALARALQRRDALWPYLAALFVYNGMLMWGFLNYLFGVGVMLWALAAWIGLRDERPALAVLVGSVLSIVIFFAHLAAFGLYALAIAGLELDRARRTRTTAAALRDLAAGAAQFAIPATIFFLRTDTPHGGLADVHTHTILQKLALAPMVLTVADPVIDAATGIALAALGVWMLLEGVRLRVMPAMRLPASLLGVAYLLLPYGIYGTWYLDVRLPIAFVFLALAAVEVRGATPRVRRAGAAVFALLLVGRTIALTREWRAFEERQNTVVAGLDVIPPGGAVYTTYVAHGDGFAEKLARWRPPLFFVASYAVVTRQAFVVPIFADPRHQPIALKPAYQREHEYQMLLVDVPPRPAELPTVVAQLQRLHFAADHTPPPPLYLLVLDDGVDGAMPPAATVAARGDGYVLYAIAAPQA